MDIKMHSHDARVWMELHAVQRLDELEFECRCTELTYHGRCGIYPSRPQVCRDFVVGSQPCLDIVRERRPGLLEEED
jgi:Fe-S-cluster containining protein